MDAAAERAGRCTFSSIVRKSAHYFGRTILQNLAQDNGVLKVAYVMLHNGVLKVAYVAQERNN